jgi:hypothetical protein
MGLHVTSIAEIARKSGQVDGIRCWVYFLNYYQFSDEVVQAFISEIPALEAHFSKLGNALLVTSIRNVDFYSDVLSWHNVVGLNPEKVCPCLFICTVPPSEFDGSGRRLSQAGTQDGEAPWFILELGKLCTNASELRNLVKRVVEAFAEEMSLEDFREEEVFNFRKRPIIHGSPTYLGVSLNLGSLKDRAEQVIKSRRARRLTYKAPSDE